MRELRLTPAQFEAWQAIDRANKAKRRAAAYLETLAPEERRLLNEQARKELGL
jgi:hypothetical protein